MTMPTLAQLTAWAPNEAEFYLARKRAKAERGEFGRDRCWGISSDALVDYVFGLRDEPTAVWGYPSDPSDLAACQRAYDMAPERVQRLMDPLMTKYREHVEDRYPHAVARVRHYLDTGVDLPAEHFA